MRGRGGDGYLEWSELECQAKNIGYALLGYQPPNANDA